MPWLHPPLDWPLERYCPRLRIYTWCGSNVQLCWCGSSVCELIRLGRVLRNLSNLGLSAILPKLWGQCWWGCLWDVLLLQQHWNLARHMLRSSSSLSRAFASPQEVHTGALRHGLRGYRTGPDHTGFSRLHRFLRDHGLGVALAADRQ